MAPPRDDPARRTTADYDPADDPGAAGARPVGPDAWRARGWRADARGTGFPWLGALLLLLGVGLLARQLDARISLGGLLLLALGLAFAGAWLFSRQRWALVPASLLLALAAGRLLRDVGVVDGDGWTSLLLGAALLLVWLVGRTQGGRHGWALWLGGLLLVVSLTQLSDRVPGFPDLGALWPVLLIVGGVVLIAGSALPFGRRSR